jgi:glycine betaine/choline ABC-type transport system substrate-binding protein
MKMRKSAIALGLVGALSLSGCALFGNPPGQAVGKVLDGPLSGMTINVASKNFTEQLLLCEITAQRLESQGASVQRTCGMSGSSAVRSALTSGAVDMYWEYTGSGWLTHLQKSETITDPEQMYRELSAADRKNGIEWLSPAAANNTYAVAIRSEKAQELGIAMVSDYAKLANSDPGSATFCGAAEFLGRDDGWPGLKDAYGIDLPRDSVAELADGAIYNAIDLGNPCNFGEVFATDGRIAALGLTVLEDDKGYFPPYNLSLNIRTEKLDENPEIEVLFEPVSALLTTTELQNLNAEMDISGKTPVEVADSWLTKNKLK